MREIGAIGYEAYAKSTGGKTYDAFVARGGMPMPKWEDLPDNIKAVWNAVAMVYLEPAYARAPAPATAQTSSRKRQPEHTLPVAFDEPTWGMVEDLAVRMNTTRAGLVRRAVRILARIVKRLDDGYEVGFLKPGENPVVLELGRQHYSPPPCRVGITETEE